MHRRTDQAKYWKKQPVFSFSQGTSCANNGQTELELQGSSIDLSAQVAYGGVQTHASATLLSSDLEHIK
jgi:hypothetical protein